MAKFLVKQLKIGNEKKGFEFVNCISTITAEEGEEIIHIPDEIDGVKITHVGYMQDYTPAHEHWHDWHHPSQGSEWVEEKYSLIGSYISFPPSVKKVIFSLGIKDVCDYAFEGRKNFSLETVENHPLLYVINNHVYRRYLPKN